MFFLFCVPLKALKDSESFASLKKLCIYKGFVVEAVTVTPQSMPC